MAVQTWKKDVKTAKSSISAATVAPRSPGGFSTKLRFHSRLHGTEEAAENGFHSLSFDWLVIGAQTPQEVYV